MGEGYALFGEKKVLEHGADKLQSVVNGLVRKGYGEETVAELKALKKNKEARSSLLGSDVLNLMDVVSLDLDAAKSKGISIVQSPEAPGASRTDLEATAPDVLSFAAFDDEQCTVLQGGYLTVNPDYCLPIINDDLADIGTSMYVHCDESKGKFYTTLYFEENCGGWGFTETWNLLDCSNEWSYIQDQDPIEMICQAGVPSFPAVSAVVYDNDEECTDAALPALGWFTPMFTCVKNVGVYFDATEMPYFNVTRCTPDASDAGEDDTHTKFYWDSQCMNSTGKKETEELPSGCISNIDQQFDSFFGYPIETNSSARMGCWPVEPILSAYPTSMPTKGPSDDDDDGPDAGTIAGATLGTLFGVGLLAAGGYYAYKNYGSSRPTMRSKTPMQDQRDQSDLSRISGFTGEPRVGNSSAASPAGNNPLHVNGEGEKKYQLFKDDAL